MSTTQPIKDKEKLVQFRNYYKSEQYNPGNFALFVLDLYSALRISGIIIEVKIVPIYIMPKRKCNIIPKNVAFLLC